MDIDLATSGLERIVGSDPPLDTIAHGLYFGEGPVWDRRNRRFLWTDIIGDTIWQWTPGVGKQIVIHPSSHANGMTFDREGRLVVAGWSARTIWRVENDGSLATIASRYQGKKFNSPNDIVVRSDGSVYWTDSAGGLVIPGMVGEDLQRQLDIQAVFRLTPQGEVKLTVEDTVYPNGLCFSPDESILYVNDTRLGLIRAFDVECRRQRAQWPRLPHAHRQRGRRCRRHEVRPGRQCLLHRPGRHPCHGHRAASSSDGCAFPAMPRIWPGATTTGRSLYVTTYHFVFRTRLKIPGVPV